MRETLAGFIVLIGAFVFAVVFKSITGVVSVLVVLLVPGAALIIAAAGIGPILFVQLPLSWYAEGVQRAKGAVQHHEAGVVTVEECSQTSAAIAEVVLKTADDHRR